MTRSLTISYAATRRDHPTSDRVVLGRGSDSDHQLDADNEDAHLSREAVIFEFDDPYWTILNAQSNGRLSIVLDGGSTTALEPGPVPFVIPHGCQGRVVVQTLRRYEVEFEVPPTPGPPLAPATPRGGDPDTSDIADGLGLTPAELQVLACLAEPRLLQGDAEASLPSHAEVSRRLDLSRKQLERHLDGISTKLAPHVEGLLGDNSRRANDRRRKVVDFALEVGAVSVGDLSLLPAPSVD